MLAKSTVPGFEIESRRYDEGRAEDSGEAYTLLLPPQAPGVFAVAQSENLLGERETELEFLRLKWRNEAEAKYIAQIMRKARHGMPDATPAATTSTTNPTTSTDSTPAAALPAAPTEPAPKPPL